VADIFSFIPPSLCKKKMGGRIAAGQDKRVTDISRHTDRGANDQRAGADKQTSEKRVAQILRQKGLVSWNIHRTRIQNQGLASMSISILKNLTVSSSSSSSSSSLLSLSGRGLS
jgi:hypothetical protein